jgi:transposase
MMQTQRVIVGMDWGDEKHAVFLIDEVTGKRSHQEVEHSPEAIAEWIASLRRQFPDQKVVICLEQTRGALIYALMKYEFLSLVPVNPKQLARFREVLGASEAKDDPDDAEFLAELFAKHETHLRIWKPDAEETRLLTLLSEDRRHCVDHRTSLTNQLKSQLKQYFPLALHLVDSIYSPLACALLERWPSLSEMQAATDEEILDLFREYRGGNRQQRQEKVAMIRDALALTTDSAIIRSRRLLVLTLIQQIKVLNGAIQEYDQQIQSAFHSHADYDIFHSFPGAGAAMGPRLLCAFGSDRERYSAAQDVQSISGIAPVTRRSGKSRVVRRRWACNKYLRQTFHEYASHSIKFSAWARAYYVMMKERTGGHQAALRSLAFKWIRILYRCWRDRQLYNESVYLDSLRRRNAPLLGYFAQEPFTE